MTAVLTFLAVLDLSLCPAVASLDAPRFRVREAVTKGITALGPLARPALLRGLTDSRAEIAARSRWALSLIDYARESYCWKRSGDLLPRGWSHLPWLSLERGYDDPAIQGYLTVAYQQGVASGWRSGWPDWRLATRVWVANHLRDYNAEPWLRDELNRMAWCEAGWTWRACCVWCVLPLRL